MEAELSKEDRDAIRGILISYRNEGVEIPLLPLDVDLDGDGVTDAWGLDKDDEVILVPGNPLDDTVYVSDGDDVRLVE